MTEGDKMEERELERKNLYIIGWMFFGIAIVYKIIAKVSGIHLSGLGLPCLFHEFTGFYCPGCGGTRAVEHLLSGHVSTSLYYHPLVLYGAVLYGWFMISNTIEYMTKGRIRIGMRYKNGYVIAGAVIIALNFFIKNGVMLIWHYPMIS